MAYITDDAFLAHVKAGARRLTLLEIAQRAVDTAAAIRDVYSRTNDPVMQELGKIRAETYEEFAGVLREEATG